MPTNQLLLLNFDDEHGSTSYREEIQGLQPFEYTIFDLFEYDNLANRYVSVDREHLKKFGRGSLKTYSTDYNDPAVLSYKLPTPVSGSWTCHGWVCLDNFPSWINTESGIQIRSFRDVTAGTTSYNWTIDAGKYLNLNVTPDPIPGSPSAANYFIRNISVIDSDTLEELTDVGTNIPSSAGEYQEESYGEYSFYVDDVGRNITITYEYWNILDPYYLFPFIGIRVSLIYIYIGIYDRLGNVTNVNRPFPAGIQTGLGVFHHIAVVAQDRRLSIYVDGVSIYEWVGTIDNPFDGINIVSGRLSCSHPIWVDACEWTNTALWSSNFTPPGSRPVYTSIPRGEYELLGRLSPNVYTYQKSLGDYDLE